VKYVPWLMGIAVSGAVWFWWSHRPVEVADAPDVAPSTPNVIPPAHVRANAKVKAKFVPEVIEPILVLPDWEDAPAPEAVADNAFDELAIRVGQMKGGASRPEIAPRPEAGRSARPWMPYAEEDRELSDTRRLQWTRLLVQEPALADLEETAEPPLDDGKRR
jgi:hypothetical protein